ncbi:MAG TPA: HlyD family secretion protein, partial [Phycisphaeraceae bacterium]
MTPPPQRRRRVGRLLVWAVVALVVAVGLVWGIPYFLHALAWESTDDAFIQGNIHTVSPRVPGRVQDVHVDDNEWVEQGQLLVSLNTDNFEAEVAAAEAALASAQTAYEAAQAQLALTRATTEAELQEAQSQVTLAEATVATAKAQAAAAQADALSAQADLRRYEQLRESESVTEQQFEHTQLAAQSAQARLQAAQQQVSQAQAELETARARLIAAQAGRHRVELHEAQARTAQAQIQQAQADLEQARLDLSYTQIRAPVAGHVTRKAVEAGEYVQPGQALLAVVPPQVWVEANFKETQLAQIRLGQPVAIHVDAYPDVTFQGRVQSIQRGTGAAFSLLPPQNATGNYVKVVQRVPVKIVFDQLPDPQRYILAPGM